MNVGRYAVTPVSSSASPAVVVRRRASAPRKSTPANPFTCRSTKPGHGDAAAAARRARRPSTTAVRRPRRRPGRAARRRALPRRRASLRRAPSARRRPAPSSRARAVVGVDAGEQRDDRDLRVAAGGVERRVDLLRRLRRSRAPTIRRTRARSFVVRRDDVDHQVAERLAEPDHRDRRDHVEHELLRRARLEPRRAGDHLGPDDDRDLVLGERAELGAVDRDDARPSARRPARASASAPSDVRRPAARAEADDRVGGADAEQPRSRARPASSSSSACSCAVAALAGAAGDRARRRARAGRRTSTRTRRRRRARAGPTSRRRRRRAGRRASSRSAIASIAAAIAAPRRATAAGTVASSAFISATSSAVERRSRSAPSGSHASVASSSSRAVVVAGRGSSRRPVYARSGRVVKTSCRQRASAVRRSSGGRR